MQKKIMVGLVLLGALAWFWLLGYGNSATGSDYISYTYLSSGTTDSTVVIVDSIVGGKKPASNLCVFNSGSETVAVTWNNNGAGAGSVPGGSSMTWNGVEIYQFTIDRTNATEVYAWTW